VIADNDVVQIETAKMLTLSVSDWKSVLVHREIWQALVRKDFF